MRGLQGRHPGDAPPPVSDSEFAAAKTKAMNGS